jgi:integrase
MVQQERAWTAKPAGWQFPIDLASYDRAAELTLQEQEALVRFLTSLNEKMHSWPGDTKAALQRLVRPLQDVLAFLDIPCKYYAAPQCILLQEMNARATSYWAWSENEWREILQPNFHAFCRRYPRFPDQTVRLQLLVIGYFFCPLHDLSSSLLRSIQPVALARRLFGRERLDQAVQRIFEVIMSWGYDTAHHKEQLTSALAEVFIVNRSPDLEDVTFAFLTDLGAQTRGHLRHSLGRISRALEHLGLIDGSLPRSHKLKDITERINSDGMAPEWAEWCIRWYRNSTLSLKTKATYLHMLFRTGRWLTQEHPEVTTPHQWTTRLAAEYVASLEHTKVGDFVDAEHVKTLMPGRFGQPLSPRSKDHQLAVMRAFFKDLQDEPHLIPHRFDPVRAFRTPHTIKNQIGPSPRDLGSLLWARLVHAALELREEDLPRIGGKESGGLRYPLAMVRAIAVVWVYTGLRCDEIVRLPTNCIRWQQEDVTVAETGEILPRDAVCFLTVPVNKTTTVFLKPVNPVVGKRINEWEQVRAAHQPLQSDRKTGAQTEYLFSHRGSKIGTGYLNRSLIPTLCARAGIPPTDERGAITSHRARATIATLLYNAPEGLSIWELMQWLGHKDPKSTQHYTRVKPTKLAAAYSKADRNSRLVEVLVDTKADVNGEVKVYYVLGDHGLCGNPDWATCLYRMACIKCPFFVPKDQAQLVEACKTVKRFMEVVELTDEELAAVQDDYDKLETAVERTRHLSAPTLLRRRAKGATNRGIPLVVLNGVSEPDRLLER